MDMDYTPTFAERHLLSTWFARTTEAHLASIARKDILLEEVPAFLQWAKAATGQVESGCSPDFPWSYHDVLMFLMNETISVDRSVTQCYGGLWALIMLLILDEYGYTMTVSVVVLPLLRAQHVIEPLERKLLAEVIRAKAFRLATADPDRVLLDEIAILLDLIGCADSARGWTDRSDIQGRGMHAAYTQARQSDWPPWAAASVSDPVAPLLDQEISSALALLEGAVHRISDAWRATVRQGSGEAPK